MVMPTIPQPITPPEPQPAYFTPPNHNEAPLILFFCYYAPSGQQQNLTIRADSVIELAERRRELLEFVASLGWTETPPAYNQPASPAEPIYVQEDNGGMQKYKVVSVEEDFISKEGRNKGKPYLRVTVAHPAITKPLPAWFDLWQDKGVATILRPKTSTPASMLPEDMQNVYIDRGPGRNGQMEYKIVSFTK